MRLRRSGGFAQAANTGGTAQENPSTCGYNHGGVYELCRTHRCGEPNLAAAHANANLVGRKGVFQDKTTKRASSLKTIFICKSLNLRVEGLDHRSYEIDERITLKHRGRWLPMIVDEILEDGGVRQVLLRVNRSADAPERRAGIEELRQLRRETNPGWLQAMISAIEGGSGPVQW